MFSQLFKNNKTVKTVNDTAYGFSFNHLHTGQLFSLQQFTGQVIVVVNTASQCGLTRQYEELEALYQRYKNCGFMIIGVPSNDFGRQEPGNERDIAEFCQINYGVSFIMTTKEIVTGHSAHPYYKWAKQILGLSKSPMWNFHKYVISRQGLLIDYFYPITSPCNKRMARCIEHELSK
jgi:glutathione peroxidase